MSALRITPTRVGEDLTSAQRATEAIPIHEEEVRLSRQRVGLQPNAHATQIDAAWNNDPDAVRNLAIALINGSQLLHTAQDSQAARSCLEEAIVLFARAVGLDAQGQDLPSDPPLPVNAVRVAELKQCIQIARDMELAGMEVDLDALERRLG